RLHLLAQTPHALPVGRAAQARGDARAPGAPAPRARTAEDRVPLARRAALTARGPLRARRPPARRRDRDRAAAGCALRRLVRALPPRGVERGDGGARPRPALLPPPEAARREAPLGPSRRGRQPEVPPPGPGACGERRPHARLLDRALHLLRRL